jgi:hypothetical protein
VLNLRDESIATPGHGLDELWPVRIISQGVPNLPDGFVDAMLKVDESIAAPDFLPDVFSRNQLSGVACQEFQEPQSLGRQFYRPAASAQLLGLQVNLEVGKP